MDQLKIGRFIAGLRKEQGMTQLDLATKLGVTDRAVSKWENGRGLPDLSLIKPLCEVLSISINELLSGQRIKEETLKVANENIIGVLFDREREIKKRRRITVMSVILAVITVVLSIIFITTLGGLLTAQLRGDGYSFSSAYYTLKARRVVEYIAGGDYEKASKLIGFYTEDRDAAEKEWSESMEELTETIYIEQFTTCDMYEDDHAVLGYTTMIVYDRESNKRFVYKIQTIAQNGGIAFGSANSGIAGYERDKQVGELIDQVLETWYAG